MGLTCTEWQTNCLGCCSVLDFINSIDASAAICFGFYTRSKSSKPALFELALPTTSLTGMIQTWGHTSLPFRGQSSQTSSKSVSTSLMHEWIVVGDGFRFLWHLAVFFFRVGRTRWRQASWRSTTRTSETCWRARKASSTRSRGSTPRPTTSTSQTWRWPLSPFPNLLGRLSDPDKFAEELSSLLILRDWPSLKCCTLHCQDP